MAEITKAGKLRFPSLGYNIEYRLLWFTFPSSFSFSSPLSGYHIELHTGSHWEGQGWVAVPCAPSPTENRGGISILCAQWSHCQNSLRFALMLNTKSGHMPCSSSSCSSTRTRVMTSVLALGLKTTKFWIYKNISEPHTCLLVNENHSHLHPWDKRRDFFFKSWII